MERARLNEARRACDRLIVGLNSNDSVRRLKGEGRPGQDERARAEVLAALEAVDFVVIFEEDTPIRLIERVRPSVLVKGGDYTREQVVGREIVEASGGEVLLVDLREGREGFDFLGCHFHARMSGRLWAQQRIIRYYLHRWPSARSMKRARQRIKALTGRSRVGHDLPVVIGELNQFLRGWGNYFRTGNAAEKFVSLDRYVAWRLKRLLIKKRGRNLHAGVAEQWTEDWFNQRGLYRLRGTVRYPKAA